MTLLTVLNALSFKDLRRALNSEKGYFEFNCSIGKGGILVKVKCTNTPKQINYGNWNGYDQIHENDDLMSTFLQGVWDDRMKKM